RNQLCTGPHGEEQCVTKIVLTPSQGHDVDLAEVKPHSTIGTIDDACTVDAANPLFSLDSELLIFGSAAHDGFTEDSAPVNALLNAAGPGKTVDVSYSLCPRGGETTCAEGTSYAALAIGNLGGKLADHDSVDTLVAAQPSYLNHALHAAPGTEAC